MSRKLIALEQLARFKENFDKVIKKLTVTVETFDPMTGVPSFSSGQIKEIIEKRPDIIRVGVIGYSDYMFLFPSWTWDDDDTAPTHCEYIHMDVDSTFNVIYYAFVKSGNEYTCTASTKSLDEGGSGGSSVAKAFHYTGEAFDDPSSPGQENFHFDVVSDEVDTILSEFPACVYFDDMYKQFQLLLYMNVEGFQMAVYNVMEDNTQYTIQFQRTGGETTITGWIRNYNGATKKDIDISNNSDQWTQDQLEDVYSYKYDIVNVTTSSNTTTLRKVSYYQGFGVLYWTFMPQQGIVINIFTYDENDGYDIQTQTRMPIVTMEVDGSDVMSQDQATLQEIYEKQPDILYVDAGNEGEQSYRKQVAKDDTISYSCMIGGYIVVVYVTEDRNANPHTYSITIERYDLSSLLVSNL